MVLIVLMVQKSGEHQWKVNVNRDLLQKRQYSRSHSHWKVLGVINGKVLFPATVVTFIYIILLYPTHPPKNVSKQQVPIIPSSIFPVRNPHCYRLHGLLKGLLGIPRQWNFLQGAYRPNLHHFSLLNGCGWKKNQIISVLIKTSWCHQLGLTRKMRPFCSTLLTWTCRDTPIAGGRAPFPLSSHISGKCGQWSLDSRGLCQLYKKHHIGPMGQVYVPTSKTRC